MNSALRACAALCLLSALTACGTAPTRSKPPPTAEHKTPAPNTAHVPKRSPYAPAKEDPSKRGDYVAGGLYAPHIKDSVPDEIVDVDAIPEPEVKAEPLSRAGNRDYAVLGKRYQVRDSAAGYVEQGTASYYGKKFHGRLTSNQEVYDMYAFTAAHKTLPLPSFARVTNLDNGKSVVVRVNDRGPFHAGRVIDLSFAAATKLGYTRQGVARVEVRALMPGEDPGAPDLAAAPTGQPVQAVVQDNSVSADEFERWMQAQGIRFAAGKPGDMPATTPVPVAVASTGTASSQPASPPAGTVGEEHVLMQLASFAARDNADRARDLLRSDGIEALRVDEASVNGQQVWRLRIGPVPASQVQALSARAAALGFGSVQIVRE